MHRSKLVPLYACATQRSAIIASAICLLLFGTNGHSQDQRGRVDTRALLRSIEP